MYTYHYRTAVKLTSISRIICCWEETMFQTYFTKVVCISNTRYLNITQYSHQSRNTFFMKLITNLVISPFIVFTDSSNSFKEKNNSDKHYSAEAKYQTILNASRMPKTLFQIQKFFAISLIFLGHTKRNN